MRSSSGISLREDGFGDHVSGFHRESTKNKEIHCIVRRKFP